MNFIYPRKYEILLRIACSRLTVLWNIIFQEWWNKLSSARLSLSLFLQRKRHAFWFLGWESRYIIQLRLTVAIIENQIFDRCLSLAHDILKIKLLIYKFRTIFRLLLYRDISPARWKNIPVLPLKKFTLPLPPKISSQKFLTSCFMVIKLPLRDVCGW